MMWSLNMIKTSVTLLLCVSVLHHQRGLVTLSLSTDQYLTHYWPITSGTMLDVVGNAHMFQGTTPTQYASDRFGNANEALNLDNGYTQVPADVYFATAFTISAWVYPSGVGTWARLVDFGFAGQTKNIVITLANGTPYLPCFYMSNPSPWTYGFCSSATLSANVWHFLAFTFDGTSARFYINSMLTVTHTIAPLSLPVNVVRPNCYIGHSQVSGDSPSNSNVDDLRFYNTSLDRTQICELMGVPCDTTTTTTTTTTSTTTTTTSTTTTSTTTTTTTTTTTKETTLLTSSSTYTHRATTEKSVNAQTNASCQGIYILLRLNRY